MLPKLYLLLFSVIHIIHIDHSKAMEDDVFANSILAYHQLAMPDIKAQRKIFSTGSLAPTCPHFGEKNVTLESIGKSLGMIPVNKSASVKDHFFTTSYFNQTALKNAAIENDKDSIIKNIFDNNSYTLKKITGLQSWENLSKENEINIENELSFIWNNVLKSENSMTIPNGVYIFGIDENLDFRILPQGRGFDQNLETLLTEYLFIENLKKTSWNGIRICHSHLFGQKNLLTAGEVEFKNGQILKISNESGHYFPHAWSIFYAIKPLYNLNPAAFSSEFEIKYMMSNYKKWVEKKWDKFLEDRDWESELDYIFSEIISFVEGNTEYSDFWKKKASTTYEDELQVLNEMGLIEEPQLLTKERDLNPDYKLYEKKLKAIGFERIRENVSRYQEKYAPHFKGLIQSEKRSKLQEIIFNHPLIKKHKSAKDIVKSYRSHLNKKMFKISFPTIIDEKKEDIKKSNKTSRLFEDHITSIIETYARQAYKQGNISLFEALRTLPEAEYWSVNDFGFEFREFGSGKEGWHNLYSYILRKSEINTITVEQYLKMINIQNIEIYKDIIQKDFDNPKAQKQSFYDDPI